MKYSLFKKQKKKKNNNRIPRKGSNIQLGSTGVVRSLVQNIVLDCNHQMNIVELYSYISLSNLTFLFKFQDYMVSWKIG